MKRRGFLKSLSALFALSASVPALARIKPNPPPPRAAYPAATKSCPCGGEDVGLKLYNGPFPDGKIEIGSIWINSSEGVFGRIYAFNGTSWVPVGE